VFDFVGVRILNALVCSHVQTIADGKAITGDLGGKGSTSQFTEAIISRVK
jgi:isocitrate/isopropylmalate dehydrogenase